MRSESSQSNGSPGLSDHLGIEIVEASTARVTGRMHAKAEHLNVQGSVHGGAIMSFADTLGAHGAMLNLRPGETTTTLESKTNFFTPGREGPLTGEAIPLHVGRSTMVWQTTLRGADDEPIATVIQTQMVMAARPMPDAAEKQAAAPETRRGDAVALRHNQIVQAACRVFARRGFAQATMRELASEAGMPVPTMYQYINSKDELLALIFDTYMAEIHASVLEAAAKGATATERLRAAVAANLASFDKYHGQILLMSRETKSLRADVRKRVLARMADYTAAFRDLIADGIADDEFRPGNAELIANFIPLLCEVWPVRYWSVGKFGLPAVRTAILDLLVDGLRNRQPSA